MTSMRPFISRLAISAIVAVVYAMVVHADPVLADKGVAVGDLTFTYGQLALIVAFGVAWGDMKRGQQEQAKSIREMADNEQAQRQNIEAFWRDRWPRVEGALDRLASLEKRLEHIEHNHIHFHKEG